jgi:outer membrane protein assembly factor BamD (BamD/ComL family)
VKEGADMRSLNCKIIVSIMMFFCLGAFVARAAVDPVIVEVHYQNGVKFFKRGLYKKAVREFENTLSLDPQNREAADHLQRAKAAVANEQIKDARESKSDEIRRFYEEGKSLYLKRDYKAAIDVFNEILAAKPIDDFASFYKERCEIMIARQLARDKKTEDKKTGSDDAARIKEEKIKEKKLKELDKQEILKKRAEISQERREAREEKAQVVKPVSAREERQRARQEKIDQKKQAREVRQEEKKALAEEKKARKEEAGQKKNEAKAQKQEKKQEQKDIKELFLKGVEEYGRKEYESAIASFEAVIEAESNGRRLYSSSAARLMDKTKIKMKEVLG